MVEIIKGVILKATGEAVYTDDIPSYKDELHAALVKSEKAHALLIAIDSSAAIAVEVNYEITN